jgi:hypothetical protein
MAKAEVRIVGENLVCCVPCIAIRSEFSS